MMVALVIVGGLLIVFFLLSVLNAGPDEEQWEHDDDL